MPSTIDEQSSRKRKRKRKMGKGIRNKKNKPANKQTNE